MSTLREIAPALARDSRAAPGPEAAVLTPSRLSPLDRGSALPPHHPLRDQPFSSYPYSHWSGGVLPEPPGRPPHRVDLRSADLRVSVDLGHGGRIVELEGPGGVSWRAVPQCVSSRDDVRGIGLRGGIELNTSPFPRSPWALEPVPAALGLTSRLGGDRLRWWQLERASHHLTQVDLHLVGAPARLVVVVRQTPLAPDLAVPAPRLLVDGVAGGLLPGIRDRVTRPAGTDGMVSWFVLAPGADDDRLDSAEERCVVAALDDPVPSWRGGLIAQGSAWVALELARLDAEGAEAPFSTAVTPVPALEHQEVATRQRDEVGSQWLHLLRDEGLGAADRVHPGDVGEPAGFPWQSQLRRARRQEALGDWRVHLRSGEIAFLQGDLDEAAARWSWSYSLRPTAWSDRNLALVALARGDRDAAAVRYLRAHRTQPSEVELGVEAIGALIAARRTIDAHQVLERMAQAGQDGTARYWLLTAEVALDRGRAADAADAVRRSGECADATVHGLWATSILESTEQEK
ncbi:tetratricopeptide repeat protein [Nocardioides carbamazepini]|uniref:tetratricopeptide repeat protein n=1 Tax=Nocardioides carbamazepini TaxID=2854259 RepID=UPI00214A098E|nr:tetratricopeptide repeat protein [Nocardioides carbamazepini]MCR1784513.1 tetratricopeptide repeat protein [Nocardioides carbamazepini]